MPRSGANPPTAGINVNDVDAPVLRFDIGDHTLRLGRFGDVRLVATATGNAYTGLLDGFQVTAGEVDFRPFGGEGLGRRQAHAAVASEHEDHLVLETHVLSSKRRIGLGPPSTTSCITSQCSAIIPSSMRKMSITAQPIDRPASGDVVVHRHVVAVDEGALDVVHRLGRLLADRVEERA
jgi:hypothetical protein